MDIHVYKGNYGSLETGILVYTKLTTPPVSVPNPVKDREIILVVDLSGSMRETLPHLRASLRAFRDSLLKQEPGNPMPSIRLIGYNNDAQEICFVESPEDPTFDQVQERLQAEGLTNMGAGLQLAFEKVDPQKATWIVVLSDGMSNRGFYQTKQAFQDLKKQTPPRTRIVALGYGTEFDADIMQAVGDDFVYINDPELIPCFFGNLSNEILTTQAFGTTVKASFRSRIVIGSTRLGSVYPGKSATFGVVPFLPIPDKAHITVSFWDLNRQQQVTFQKDISFPDVLTEPPNEVKIEYYRFASSRRLRALYSALRSPYLRPAVQTIQNSLKKWTDPCAQEAKAEVLRFIAQINQGRDLRLVGYELAGTASDTERQYPILSLTDGAKRTLDTYQLYL